MARERFENNAITTLNGAINDSVTTVTVDDASKLSSNPQFRILVEDEIMLVTGISGNNLTVTRGAESTTAASHADGLNVVQLVTVGGFQRYNRDWNNPFFEAGTPMQLLDSSGNTLTASSFTDINFTNASKADSSQGSIVLQHDTQGATPDNSLIVKSAPSAPWIFTVGFIPNLLNELGDFPAAGPAIRDSSSGKIYTFQFLVGNDGVWLRVIKQDSPTSNSIAFLSFRDWSNGSPVSWLQIEDDNTDLIFRYSADGVNYVTMGQEARTAYLTPDQIGFSISNFGNANVKSMATIVAWEEA